MKWEEWTLELLSTQAAFVPRFSPFSVTLHSLYIDVFSLQTFRMSMWWYLLDLVSWWPFWRNMDSAVLVSTCSLPPSVSSGESWCKDFGIWKEGKFLLTSKGMHEFTKINISMPKDIRRSHQPQHLWGQPKFNLNFIKPYCLPFFCPSALHLWGGHSWCIGPKFVKKFEVLSFVWEVWML